MEIKRTQASRKHKIDTHRVLDVLNNPTATDTFPAPVEGQDDRTVWVGDDSTGLALEVITVPLPDGRLLVLHAMPLRDKYRYLYEGTDR